MTKKNKKFLGLVEEENSSHETIMLVEMPSS